ncbi:hypothetical protein PAGU2196_49450 [Pseudomonas sp. PAGU 2196]|nr:hypothetical protein PAGU2196_49450 [Pseudomonas sp. PAGU 2196]
MAVDRITHTIAVSIECSILEWAEAVRGEEPHHLWVKSPVTIAKEIAVGEVIVALPSKSHKRGSAVGGLAVSVCRIRERVSTVATGMVQYRRL